MDAGEYPDYLRWWQHSYGTPDAFGQKPDEYTDMGYLWGVIEGIAAGTTDELSATGAQTTATIRLRNYPAVAPLDTLGLEGLAEEWVVNSIARGDNELICQVSR